MKFARDKRVLSQIFSKIFGFLTSSTGKIDSTRIPPARGDLVIQIENSNKKSNYEREVEKTGWKKYAGLVFTILTSISSSFTMLIGKILVQKNYHPLNVAFGRYQAMIICGPLFIIYMKFVKKQNVFQGILDNKGRTLILLLVRGTIGLACMSAFTYSLEYLKLGDATVIFFSTPIAVFLFARIFLGESCGFVPIFAALVTFIGVGVLTRPPLLTGAAEFESHNLIGISLAFVAMLFVTGIFLITRYLRKVHFCLPINFLAYTASIESLIILLALGIFEMPRNKEDWLITGAGAVAELFVQIFLVLSLKYEAAGPVAMIRTLDIVFTFILQMIFFGVFPDIFSLIGASIIMIGIVLTGFRKWLSTLPTQHSARSKFWFMLK